MNMGPGTNWDDCWGGTYNKQDIKSHEHAFVRNHHDAQGTWVQWDWGLTDGAKKLKVRAHKLAIQASMLGESIKAKRGISSTGKQFAITKRASLLIALGLGLTVPLWAVRGHASTSPYVRYHNIDETYPWGVAGVGGC